MPEPLAESDMTSSAPMELHQQAHREHSHDPVGARLRYIELMKAADLCGDRDPLTLPCGYDPRTSRYTPLGASDA